MLIINVTIMNTNSFLVLYMAQVKKDKLKQDIINTSINLFYLYGYNNTSIKMISQKLNISVGNIYNYFKNKEEIFNTILNDDFLNSVYEFIKIRSNIILKKELNLEVPNFEEDWLKNTFYPFLIENYKLLIILKNNLTSNENLKNKFNTLVNKLIDYKKQLVKKYCNKDIFEGYSWLSYSVLLSNIELYVKILENELTTTMEKIDKLSLLDLYQQKGMQAVLNKIME